MRDDETFDSEDETRPAGGWRPVLGAGLSLCLLGATVVWIYQLGMRDAAEVPVIRALAGETKMRPDTPGGARFAHQDRSVYDVIDAGGAAPTGIALAPAPERPTDEDLPAARLAALAERAAAPVAAEPASAPEIAPEPSAAPDAAAPAPEDELASHAELPPSAGGEVDRLVALVLEDAGATAFDAPGPAAPRSSPVAPPRPPRAAAARPAASESGVPVLQASYSPAEPARAQPAAAQAAVAQPDGANLEIGAYLTRGDAERMWAAFRARNGDLMAGREPVISPIVSGGRNLWLLRAAGFERRADASAVCDALKARGEECVARGG
ncbi:MAG: SPOR domain-containing protein [Rubrimonas sp.]|uniref:SPOR domain-containing protein n=1 Tax=Rubrimonas sp. TaxID=2036015 RepID=UPI002FDCAD93